MAEQNKYTFDGAELGIVPLSTQIANEVPPGTYTFSFNQMTGLHVIKCEDVPEVPHKVYGGQELRVAKVYRAFDRRPRNTGVLLSGEPGMGKSLFIRMIAAEAKKRGLPVFVVNSNCPGLVAWLKRCHTHSVVILDEFEKIFACGNNNDGEGPDQEQFLSLLDGMSDSKKLFVAAINDTWKLNKFMLNRPGRFLYHYQFGCLTQKEIVQYLEDNLTDKEQVDYVANILLGHKINFDSLACIVAEINAGEPIDETMQDLNLDGAEQKAYDASVTIDGQVYTGRYEINFGSAIQQCRLVWKPGFGEGNGKILFKTVDVSWRTQDILPASKDKYNTGMLVKKAGLRFARDGRDMSILIHNACDHDEYVTVNPNGVSDMKLSEHYEYSGSSFYAKGAGATGPREEAPDGYDY